MTRQLFRTALAAALATTLLPLSAHAEYLTPAPGQVSCADYDAESSDCASIQHAKLLDDGRIAISDEVRFDFGGEEFAVASGFIAKPTDGRLCLAPNSITIHAIPADHPVAQELAVKTGVSLRMAALQGACVEHRKCGEDFAAVFVLGGEPMPEMTTRFRVFEAGDAAAERLKPRAMGPAQLAAMGGADLGDCGPLGN